MNVPKLRFGEFKSSWKFMKLGQLGNTIAGLTYSPKDIRDSGLLVLRSSNVKDGQIDLGDCVYVDTNVKGAKISQENDILICVRNGSTSLIGKNALIPAGIPHCTHGAFMTVFRAEQPKFIHQLFQTTNYKTQVSADLGARINSINNSQLIKYQFAVPPTECEQQKIADFLSAVDDKITALTAQKTALTQYKQGMMQRIFAQTLRFKDDNGADYPEWNDSELGKLCTITTGKLDANAMVENGKYRFYTCAQDYYFIDNYAFDTDALLISGNGANVGYIHHYNGKFNAYQRTYVLDGFTESIVFIKYYLEQFLHIRIFTEKKEGNTPYIVMSVLSEMPIRLPIYEEQTKIAQFLTECDGKINAVDTQILSAQQWKQGLLQQMFV